MKTSRRAFLLCTGAAVLLPGPRRLDGKDPWDPMISENLWNVEPPTLRWLAQLGCRHVVF